MFSFGDREFMENLFRPLMQMESLISRKKVRCEILKIYGPSSGNAAPCWLPRYSRDSLEFAASFFDPFPSVCQRISQPAVMSIPEKHGKFCNTGNVERCLFRYELASRTVYTNMKFMENYYFLRSYSFSFLFNFRFVVKNGPRARSSEVLVRVRT